MGDTAQTGTYLTSAPNQNFWQRNVSGPFRRNYVNVWKDRSALQEMHRNPTSLDRAAYRPPVNPVFYNMVVNPGHQPGTPNIGFGPKGGTGRRDQFLGSSATLAASALGSKYTLARKANLLLGGGVGLARMERLRRKAGIPLRSVPGLVGAGLKQTPMLLPKVNETPLESSRRHLLYAALLNPGGGYTSKGIALNPLGVPTQDLRNRLSTGYANKSYQQALSAVPPEITSASKLVLPGTLADKLEGAGGVYDYARKYGPDALRVGRFIRRLKPKPEKEILDDQR